MGVFPELKGGGAPPPELNSGEPKGGVLGYFERTHGRADRSEFIGCLYLKIQGTKKGPCGGILNPH